VAAALAHHIETKVVEVEPAFRGKQVTVDGSSSKIYVA